MALLTTAGTVPNEALDAFLLAVEGDGVSVVYTAEASDFKGEPLPSSLHFEVTLWVEEQALDNVQAAVSTWWPDAAFEPVGERDWVAENQASFPPLEIGRWRIVRESGISNVEPGKDILVIKPAHAFGSGEHATTQQCLHHYARLVDAGEVFETGLDVGCGSGILALAAAAHGGTRMLGSDIEPPSVAATLENARVNGVGDLVDAFEGSLPEGGDTYPLVFANILLAPLLDMADGLAACVGAGGYLILSGFRDGEQAEAIAARYAPLGLTKVHETVEDGWVAQTWQKQ